MAIPKLQAYALPTALDVPVNKVDWAFDPERAALLIHDMQDYFIGFWGDNCPMMEQVVANIAEQSKEISGKDQIARVATISAGD